MTFNSGEQRKTNACWHLSLFWPSALSLARYSATCRAEIRFLHCNLRGACPFGGMETDEGVVSLAECSMQPRDFQIRCDQIALQMVAFGAVDGRVQFDQRLAGFDALAIADVNRANHSGFERLNDLVCPVGKTLPGAVATISMVPIKAQASATPNRAMIEAAMARPVGEGGVSTISSAAGRNSSSAADYFDPPPSTAVSETFGLDFASGFAAPL